MGSKGWESRLFVALGIWDRLPALYRCTTGKGRNGLPASYVMDAAKAPLVIKAGGEY